MKVSVSIITYNHENCISQAVESALMQKTDFDYEILIGEDDSSDGTREICKEYAAKHPDKIRLFLNDRKNVIYINGQPTGRWNLINLLKNSKGKYIAICDGDDYWTDPYKLQKQVDFLESHHECAICFHNVEVLNEDSQEKHLFFSWKLKPIYTFDDLVGGPFFPTCSAVFRGGLVGEFPEWFYTTPMGDWPLFLLIAQHGDIGCINEVLGVRRQHKGGVWHSKGTINQLKGLICAAETMKHHFGSKSRTKFNETIGQYHHRIARLLWEENDYLMASVHATKYLTSSPRISISIVKRLFRVRVILRERFPRMYHFLRQAKKRKPFQRGDVN